MRRVCRSITYVSVSSNLFTPSNLKDKAARCTEIFAALTSADGYIELREEIGSDPVVSVVQCPRSRPSGDECLVGTRHVFDPIGSSYLGCVPQESAQTKSLPFE